MSSTQRRVDRAFQDLFDEVKRGKAPTAFRTARKDPFEAISDRLLDELSDPRESRKAKQQRLLHLATLLSIIAAADQLSTSQIADGINDMVSDRNRALKHLLGAAALLREPYDADIRSLASKVERDIIATKRVTGFAFFLNPERLGRSGSAAVNDAAARRGWYIKTVHDLVPKGARNRARITSELLRHCGVTTTEANVRSVVGSENRKNARRK